MSLGGFQQHLSVRTFDNVDRAPNYVEQGVKFSFFEIMEANVVGKGMKSGAATVDLVIRLPNGDKAIVMMPGTLIKALASAIIGTEERTLPPDVYGALDKAEFAKTLT